MPWSMQRSISQSAPVHKMTGCRPLCTIPLKSISSLNLGRHTHGTFTSLLISPRHLHLSPHLTCVSPRLTSRSHEHTPLSSLTGSHQGNTAHTHRTHIPSERRNITPLRPERPSSSLLLLRRRGRLGAVRDDAPKICEAKVDERCVALNGDGRAGEGALRLGHRESADEHCVVD